ncbi:HD domain-containing protein [bacterium]|nr:HD domain-containing protein [bacterium]
MTWTQTHSGKRFDIFNPRDEDVCIEDIAHALAHICRFNGHTKKFYSVAEHSLHTARIAAALSTDPRVAWAALMHDAHEAYTCDIPKPWRAQLWAKTGQNFMASFDIICAQIEKTIFRKLSGGLVDFRHSDSRAIVTYADEAMLVNEKRLALFHQIDWGTNGKLPIHVDHVFTKLDFLKPPEAAFQFLKAYQEIEQCLHSASPCSSWPLLSLRPYVTGHSAASAEDTGSAAAE